VAWRPLQLFDRGEEGSEGPTIGVPSAVVGLHSPTPPRRGEGTCHIVPPTYIAAVTSVEKARQNLLGGPIPALP